jgi:hypothetical protein
VKVGALCVSATLLVGLMQADGPEERSRRFAALLTAIHADDAAEVASLSRVNDIMLMRGYVFMSARELLDRLRGCAVTRAREPTTEGGGGMIHFACPGRAARVALEPCDSGDLALGVVAKDGRLQLSLSEMRRMEGACIPPPPAPPPRPPGT